MKLKYDPSITVAAVDLDKCNVALVGDGYYKLSPGAQKFVIEHERAHCRGAEDEKAADRKAFRRFHFYGGTLAQAIEAMNAVPDPYTRETRIKNLKDMCNCASCQSGKREYFDTAACDPNGDLAVYLDCITQDQQAQTDADYEKLKRGNRVREWLSYASDALDLIGGIGGGRNPQTGYRPMPPAPEPNNNNILIIGAVVAVVVIVVVMLRK